MACGRILGVLSQSCRWKWQCNMAKGALKEGVLKGWIWRAEGGQKRRGGVEGNDTAILTIVPAQTAEYLMQGIHI